MTRVEEANASQKYNANFLKYIKAFADVGKHSRLFPKKCRTCGHEYADFPQYIQDTLPVGHGLEPYKDSGDALHTMQYRNCRCGSTLSIDLTEDEYPLLESFWEMLGKESKERARPIREVVLEFREQCNRYMSEQHRFSGE
ncbi:MAG: hypothetical protein HY914_02555 [Desulfomonile tiedjei]|nr:hypothetical protein [Desulfomonile tiedjei]